MQDFLVKERKRVHVEEELEKLEMEVNNHAQTLAAHLQKVKESAMALNAPALQGWINEAMTEAEKARELDGRILHWEQYLLSLVKKQRRELMDAE